MKTTTPIIHLLFMENHITKNHAQRRAFTLVELLVVIAVISVLMGLILVGVNSAREMARRTQCINNQRQVSLAIQSYVGETNGQMPALVNTKKDLDISWALILLPYMEFTSTYDNFLKDGGTQDRVPTYLCPSDSDKKSTNETDALSYVVNSGRYVETPSDADRIGKRSSAMECAAFVDRRASSSIKIDSIHSKANTILFTENVQAERWSQDYNSRGFKSGQFWMYETVDGKSAGRFDRGRDDAPSESGGATKCIGFRWGNNLNDVNDQLNRINIGMDTVNSFATARPSSRHPGVVVVSFADGRTDTVNDSIDLDTFNEMCDPLGHDH